MHCHPKEFQIQLPSRGVLIRRGPDGVHHAFKRIGLKHYPSCYGWMQETIQKGPSVLISPKTDLSMLTRESKLVMVHPRAIIVNAKEYRDTMRIRWDNYTYCPIDVGHADNDLMPLDATCVRHWQCDMDIAGNPALPVSDRNYTPHSANYYWQGDMRFWAHPRSEDINPVYEQGVVAAIPMRLVIEDGERASELYEGVATGLEKSIQKR